MNRIELRRNTHVEDIGDGAGLVVDGCYRLKWNIKRQDYEQNR